MLNDREFDPYLAVRHRQQQEDEQTSWVAVCLLVMLLTVICLLAWKRHATARECLRMGYPASSYGIVAGGWCYARERQSDIVIPISRARQRPR
jgi:hypothetical protein